MSNVELRTITKRFKDVTALDDVSFSIHDGEFFVLLGPTGAGKTTTLRVIAGLERQDGGDVLFDDVNVSGYTPDALDRWGARVRAWRAGESPAENPVGPPAVRTPRDVFVYFDNDAKVHAPFDAIGLAERLA